MLRAGTIRYLESVPSGVRLQARRAEAFGEGGDPYLRLVLAEVVDVGISEHTVKVCDASRTTRIPPHRTHRHHPEVDMVRGLGTVIYQVADLDRAKAWYSTAFQQKPYFDEPFYVGFNVAGYELGLHPADPVNRPGPGGSVAYWRVASIEAAVQHFVGAGAKVVVVVQDVGEGIKVATVADPFGNLIGLIENPHFALPADVPAS